ncbi:MAG: VTT domain-containing protein [Elusimicrobia bacterium]|nr:VTT domain-containing protein [Elusimicrobiota bacterium]
MITELTGWILETLRIYGAWSVFTGVMIEQVIVPIPSPVIIMGAGMILIPPGETWAAALAAISGKIVVPGTIASLLGAVLGYYLGLWGGKTFVDHFQRYLGFSWKDVERFSQKLTASRVGLSLFLLRALPVVPLSLISIVCGVMEVRMKTFLIWSAIGFIPRCFLLSVLGWQMGGSALRYAKGMDRVESIVSLGVAALVVGMILYVRKRVRSGMEGA